MNILLYYSIQKYQTDHKMSEKYTDTVNNS